MVRPPSGDTVELKLPVPFLQPKTDGGESVGVVFFHRQPYDIGVIRRIFQRIKIPHHQIRDDLLLHAPAVSGIGGDEIISRCGHGMESVKVPGADDDTSAVHNEISCLKNLSSV